MNVTDTNDAGTPDAPETAPLDLGALASTESEAAPVRRRRRWPLVAGLAAIVVTSGGAIAYADARKTIDLDVNGEVTTVTTMAGSVDGLLEEQGVDVANRDLVAPAADSALEEGSDVVVRYANEVGVQADGEQEDVWTTALDADEALDAFASRGDDVRLVASRSGAEGRQDIPLRLDVDGPVNLVVGDETTVIDDGSVGVDAILEDNNVELGEDDRVSVVRDDEAAAAEGIPAVSVLVERVEVKTETETSDIDFETKTVEDADRYDDLGTAVQSEGAKGERTVKTEVTYLNGEVESEELISDEVTTESEDRVLVEGTKERPAPEPEPEPEPAPAATSSSSKSSSSSSKSQGSAPAGVWSQLAQCESGGNPATNTGNGYYGLYQFSAQTWQAMGGSGLPSDASAAEQTQRAQALQAQSGWGQWPGCASKLGLL